MPSPVHVPSRPDGHSPTAVSAISPDGRGKPGTRLEPKSLYPLHRNDFTWIIVTSLGSVPLGTGHLCNWPVRRFLCLCGA